MYGKRNSSQLALAFSSIGTAIQGIVRFLYNVLVGRLRGKAFFGPVSAAIASSMFVTMLYPQSAANAATKFVSRSRGAGNLEEADAVAWYLGKHILGVSAALAVGVSFFVAAITNWNGWLGVTAGMLTITYSSYIFSRGVQYAHFRAYRATVADTISGVLSVSLLLVVLFAHWDMIVLLPLVIGYGCSAAINWPKPASRPSASLRKEIRRFVVIGAIGTLAVGGFLQLSMVVAQVSGGKENSGYYAAALTLATPLSMMATAFGMIITPAMSAAHGRADQAGLRFQTDVATRAVFSIAVGGFGALALASPFIISIIYPGYGPSISLLPLLTLAVMCTTIQMPAMNNIIVGSATGIVKTSAVGLLGILVGSTVWIVLVPPLGNLGIAIGLLAGLGISAAILIAIVWRRDNYPWFGLLVRFGLATVAIIAGVILEQLNDSALFSLAIALLFVAMWTTLVWIYDRKPVMKFLFAMRP